MDIMQSNMCSNVLSFVIHQINISDGLQDKLSDLYERTEGITSNIPPTNRSKQ